MIGQPRAATRLVAVTALGTLLNPLNSSMIAVALVSLQHHFDVSVATVSWLVSGFYLTAAAAQPVMGRLIDHFGARRVFLIGLATVAVVCAAAPFAPEFGWVVAARVGLALGTSTAYPAALAIIRSSAGAGRTDPPATALATITVANSTSAALGPVIGGVLVAYVGWQAIFLLNVPLALAGFGLAFRMLPTDTPRTSAAPAPAPAATPLLRRLDLPGVACFSGALTALLMLLLSLPDGPRWWLLGPILVLGPALVWWERRAAEPFIDLRELAANTGLSSVLAQQVAFNLVFYCLFFGLPIWLESGRGVDPDTVGLLVLPIAAAGVIMTPVAARLIRRHGSQTSLLVGATVLLAGSLLVQVLDESTPLLLVAAIAILFGLPNGFSNLGLQTALYQTALPERTASSGGLFQTGRYLGSMMSTSVIGIVFATHASDASLHQLGFVMTAAAVIVLALAAAPLSRPVRPARSDAP